MVSCGFVLCCEIGLVVCVGCKVLFCFVGSVVVCIWLVSSMLLVVVIDVIMNCWCLCLMMLFMIRIFLIFGIV